MSKVKSKLKKLDAIRKVSHKLLDYMQLYQGYPELSWFTKLEKWCDQKETKLRRDIGEGVVVQHLKSRRKSEWSKG